MAADSAAGPSFTDPLDPAADPFNDDPLPLFLTDPVPEMDRDLEVLLRIIFGIYA
jgi:hypothetical protein